MRRVGFTLLEVIVALAILAVSLTSILGISGQAVSSHIYAHKLTLATQLARSKMTDLEQRLYDKPLPTDDEEDSGDFADELHPEFKWRARILVPHTATVAPLQLFSAMLPQSLPGQATGAEGVILPLLAGMFGADAGTPSPQGQMSQLGPFAGLAQMQFTQMLAQIERSTREVHLLVTWREGAVTESFDLVTHVVSFNSGFGVTQTNPPANSQTGVPQSSVQ